MARTVWHPSRGRPSGRPKGALTHRGAMPCGEVCHCDLQPEYPLDRQDHPCGPDGRGAYPLYRPARRAGGHPRRPDAARNEGGAALAGRSGAGGPEKRPRHRQDHRRPAARARPPPASRLGAPVCRPPHQRPGVMVRVHPPGRGRRAQSACAPGRARPGSRHRQARGAAVRERGL